MSSIDPDSYRADSREHWDVAAAGWGRAADRLVDWAAGVSVTMIDALALQPGDRVLELAAGPGDTGFMAAELIIPGGTLICSDGSEAMLEVARQRAAARSIDNVEFRLLDLEWIDVPTASVDAVLCRWGIMLILDPPAAAREIRRVLRPGGRAALAVWDLPERNPWTTIPRRVLHELGHAPAPDPDAPNQFSLGAPGMLGELLADAGLLDVTVGEVAMPRTFADLDEYLGFVSELASSIGTVHRGLDPGQRDALHARLAQELAPFTDTDGTISLPSSSLVAVAGA
jgi:SAM-dependent methyltransferase